MENKNKQAVKGFFLGLLSFLYLNVLAVAFVIFGMAPLGSSVHFIVPISLLMFIIILIALPFLFKPIKSTIVSFFITLIIFIIIEIFLFYII